MAPNTPMQEVCSGGALEIRGNRQVIQSRSW